MKLLTWITLPPLALVTIFLAVANRHRVLFSFDPFDPGQPALALEMPLFAIVLAAVFAGMLIGGASAWMRQDRRRKAADVKRTRTLEAARLEKSPAPPPTLEPDRPPAALAAPPPAAD